MRFFEGDIYLDILAALGGECLLVRVVADFGDSYFGFFAHAQLYGCGGELAYAAAIEGDVGAGWVGLDGAGGHGAFERQGEGVFLACFEADGTGCGGFALEFESNVVDEFGFDIFDGEGGLFTGVIAVDEDHGLGRNRFNREGGAWVSSDDGFSEGRGDGAHVFLGAQREPADGKAQDKSDQGKLLQEWTFL